MRTFPKGPKKTWAAQAREIASGAEHVPDSDLPALLGWLQDGNWPGADEIAGFLAGLGTRVVPAIREVLEGADKLWAYWVVRMLVLRLSAEACRLIEGPLWQLAIVVDEEGAHVEALRTCAKHLLAPREEIVRIALQKRECDLDNTAEYNEILRCLGES